MIKLIHADIKRILAKRSIIFIYIAVTAYVLVRLLANNSVYHDSFVNVRETIGALNLFQIANGIIVFFAVYADDFKSACYVIAIGRGTSRARIIAAKLLDSAILLGFMYGIMVLLVTLVFKGIGGTFDDTLAMAWFGTAFISYYKSIGYIALASLVLYITNNVPLGIIAIVALYVAVPTSTVLLGMNETVRKFHIERFHYAGLADNALSDLLFGSYGMAVIKLLAGFVIYFGGVLLITRVLFDRKELDF